MKKKELTEKQQEFLRKATVAGVDHKLFGDFIPEIKLREEKPKTGKPTICYIHTGGTLAMVPSKKVSGTLSMEGSIDIEKTIEVCHQMGYVRDYYNIIGVYLANIDSKEVIPSLWTALAATIKTLYQEIDGVVIGHGTHTLEYTAAALAFSLRHPAIPIVLTASQIPIIGFPGSDGFANLTGAMQIAGYSDIAEVVAYSNGVINRGSRTIKKNDKRMDVFEARVTGPLGFFCAGGNNVELKPGVRRRSGAMKYELIFQPHFSKSVTTVKLTPGMNFESVAQMVATKSDQGMIIETYGSGALPMSFVKNVLEKVLESEFPFYLTSSCGESGASGVMQGHDEDAQAVAERNIVNLRDMTTAAATVKLMSVLALLKAQGEKQTLPAVTVEMLRNWADEISPTY